MARKKEKRIHIMQESRKLLKDFIRRDFLKEDILEQPQSLRHTVTKLNIITFFLHGIIFSFFSYLTLAGNYFIEQGFGIIGIIFYMLYCAQSIIRVISYQWENNLRTEIEFAQNDSLTLAGSKILSKVAWNVYKTENNHWVQVRNEEITNTIASYLNGSWNIQNKYWIDIAQVVSTAVMLVLTIITNRTIPQWKFILLLVIAAMANFICSAVDRFHRSEYKKEDRKLNNEKDIIKNDILRVVPIIPIDQECRIKRYHAISHVHFQKKHELINKDFITDIISRFVHVATSCSLIILYISSCSEISLATIAGMTASLAIFDSAINSTYNITNVFISRSKDWDEINKETEMLQNILQVYHSTLLATPKAHDELPIPAFKIQYNETSENDRPFQLILDEEKVYTKGDCIVLTGASGSGKSTFLKIATNRIAFSHNAETEFEPINYMFYDDSIDFGSMPLWDELFCLDPETRPEPSQEEIAKMQYILTEMMIYQEIAENCSDFWVWLKEHRGNELSRGQKQRMIVSKILFWMNSDIDIIALDECTSGLDAETADNDNADAMKIIRFIIDFCNRDKKRILFFSTHQNIIGLCNHQLHFQRSNGKTTIQSIF